jgi:hypothetical protein
VEETADKPLSRTYGIPAYRRGSTKNNESEIIVLKRKIKELEKRIEALEP